jgi:hypothetical protein
MTAIVRNITSGDPVSIEFKGYTAYTAVLRTRLFIHTNESPIITGGRADQSRIIHIEVSESKQKNDPDWEKKLITELPQFLFKCREAYQKLCPNHGEIVVPESIIEAAGAAAADIDYKWEIFFDQHFQVNETGSVDAKDVARLLQESGYKDSFHQKDFKAFVKRKFKINPDGKRNNGTIRCYRGMVHFTDSDRVRAVLERRQ